MTRSVAVALMIAAASLFPWTASKAQESHETHHPPQAAAEPAQTQPAPQATPSTTTATAQAAMPMMNMMGGPQMMGMMNMMGMMRMMGMPGPGMGGMGTIDRVEGRIAFIRAELKITDAQTSAWNPLADALRANAKKLGEVRKSMMATGTVPQTPTISDRLALQEQWLVARLEGTRAIKSAVVALYAVLSDDQKQTANEILAPHMGMGMMAMMSGPRQMMPGAMMRQQSPRTGR